MITSLDQTSPQIRRSWYALQDVFKWVFFSSFYSSLQAWDVVGKQNTCFHFDSSFFGEFRCIFWRSCQSVQMVIIVVKMFNKIASFSISVKLEMPKKDPLKNYSFIPRGYQIHEVFCSISVDWRPQDVMIRICPEMQVDEMHAPFNNHHKVSSLLKGH